MKKLLGLLTGSDASGKISAIVALALALAAFLCVVVSASTAINGAITSNPVMKTFMPKDELDQIDDYAEELVDLIDEAIDEDEDDILDEIEDRTDMSPKKVMKLCDPLSLKGLVAISQIRGDEDAEMGAKLIINIIRAVAAFICVFIVFAGLFFKKGLMITANVISFLFFLLLVGFVWFILFTAICIAYCIFASRANKAYKNLSQPAPVAEAVAEAEAEA